MLRRALLAVMLLGLPGYALAAPCASLPYTFINGIVADANQVNANFASVIACINTLSAQTSSTQAIDNTALKSLSTLAIPTGQVVVRNTFGATPAIPAPPQVYTASLSPCSLNAGAGDDGSQVRSANGRCWLAKFSTEGIDPRVFGAICDGANPDDSGPLNAAIAAAIAANIPLKFTGNCNITSSLNINGPIDFEGTNSFQAVISPLSGVTAIQINTASTVTLQHFSIQYAVLGGGGTFGIIHTAPASESDRDTYNDLSIVKADTCMHLDKSEYYTISHVTCNGSNTGIVLTNTFNVDNGDGTLTDNTILATVNCAIQVISGAGTKIIGNKINTAANGICLTLANGASTSDLIITGNSIEGTGMTAALNMSRQGATGTFENVPFTGNQVAGPIFMILSPTDANGAWLTEVSSTGNTYSGPSAGNPVVYAVDSVTNFNLGQGDALISNVATTKVAQLGGASGAGMVAGYTTRGTFSANANSGTANTLGLTCPAGSPTVGWFTTAGITGHC